MQSRNPFARHGDDGENDGGGLRRARSRHRPLVCAHRDPAGLCRNPAGYRAVWRKPSAGRAYQAAAAADARRGGVAGCPVLRRGVHRRRPDAHPADRQPRPRHRRRRHHADQGARGFRRSGQSPAECRSGANVERIPQPLGHRHRGDLGGAVHCRSVQRRADRAVLRHLFRRRPAYLCAASGAAGAGEAARRHCRDDVRDRRPAAPLADRPGHLHGADRQLHLYRPA